MWERGESKAGWPNRGPWDDEPDCVIWVEPVTKLTCVINRAQFGALCGYVEVPADHPWSGVGYSGCPIACGGDWCDHTPERLIDVHGTLTYAGRLCKWKQKAGWPKPLPRTWFFGFDCAHSNDVVPAVSPPTWYDSDAVYRDIDYVRGECIRLAKQLACHRNGGGR